jgi:hypothetical protein
VLAGSGVRAIGVCVGFIGARVAFAGACAMFAENCGRCHGGKAWWGGGNDDLGGSALLQLCEYLSVSLMWGRAVKWLSQMCRYEPYGGESLYIFTAS